MVAPILGGVTRRDPTDLMALAVLPLIWWWPGDAEPPRAVAEPLRRRLPASAAAGVAVAVQTLAIGAAAATTTATSCDAGPGVSAVDWDGERFVAAAGGGAIDRWSSSDGVTWTLDGPATAGDIGQTEVVALDDGTEARIDGARVDIVASDGGAERYESNRAVGSGCAGDAAESYAAVASDGSTVVVAMGAAGVSVRAPDGEWSEHRVGSFDPATATTNPLVSTASRVVAIGSIVAFVAGCIAVLVLRFDSKAKTFAVFVAGGLGVLVAELIGWVVIEFVTGNGPATLPLLVWSAVCTAIWAGALAAVNAARSR